MLNAAIANGDVETLKELFKIYNKINEEKEILRISGKLINKCLKLSKDDLIDILDRCYEIVEKYREDFRSLTDMMAEKDIQGISIFCLTAFKINLYEGKKNESNHIKEYRYVVAGNASEEIRKLIKEMRKGLQNINEENVNKFNC